MKLKEALGINYGEVISLVGGGGKTTLMFALARELATGKGCVITTTTTKIFEPSLSQTQYLLLEKEEDRIVDILKQSMEHYNHITLAKSKLSSGKLEGVSPDLIFKLAGIKGVSCVVVEADGANHLPLKAPNATEPVIPFNTSLLVPVVGIDAVGCNLDEENVFRPQIVSEITGIPIGEIITIESIAFLITDNRGIIKGSPDHTRIIPFINKVDLDNELVKAMDLAKKILEVGHPQIKQVILGQAQSEEPVVEVVTSGAR